ncbi:MAG: hypothetical protein WBD22_00570 [Pyrinomonadaceae bacterium]
MFEGPAYLFIIGAASCVLAVFATFAVRNFARRYGYVAQPKSDRWHKRPTAMLGGIAIFLTTLIIYLSFVPKTLDSAVVMSGATFLFGVGLVDDLVNIKPYQKLVGQLFGAVVIAGFGLTIPLTGYQLIDIWLTVFWLIGITNAINLLDNMDGLAAGISAIAATWLAVSFAANGQTTEAVLVAGFVGALIGFLVFNFKPASIFMGDCGSMFVGFLLSASVLMGQSGGRSRGVVSVLAVPVLILFVPIFDTTLVTVLRKLWGRRASQGGRDHTSHRLVALGLSERKAVLVLFSFAFVAGGVSYFVSQIDPIQSFALIALFTVVLVLIGVYLSKVKVYDEGQDEAAVQNNAVFTFIVDMSYKRRIFEVLLDAIMITLAYYASYLLLFGPFEQTVDWDLFIKTLPILLVMKIGAFLVAGVYRGLWRYTSIGDFVTFTKGVLLGSGLSVLAILLLYRFQNFSRAVFVVDAIILLFGLVVSRMTFRLLRQFIPSQGFREGRKVLIYGAGDGGEMVLRELKNNLEWNYQPVGFIDDDPHKIDRVIHGLRVWNANGSLREICREKGIEEILVSFRNIPAERLEAARAVCRDERIELKRAHITIDDRF